MTDRLLDFSGKVALVTGGSRGLGREMVMALAERGADLIIASRKIEACETVAEEVRSMGRRALAIGAHCGKWDEIDGLIEAAYAEFGRVDILVNNAGMGPRMPSEEVPENLYDSVLNLNLKGPYRLSSVIGKRMKDAGSGHSKTSSSTRSICGVTSWRMACRIQSLPRQSLRNPAIPTCCKRIAARRRRPGSITSKS